MYTERGNFHLNKKLKEKISESVSAVLPVTLIVMILCSTVTPMPLEPIVLFVFGAFLLILGMGFFTLGAETAMMPIGEALGRQLTKIQKLGLLAVICFIIGILVTIAEPDLQVLADQTPAVPNMVLILTVAVGVGVFLAVSFVRELLGIGLTPILIVCYTALFILAFFVPQEFLAVAFDAGGVTTGPITVPFIMALGIGLSSRSFSKDGKSDSFGMIALCSIGPILSVLILGLVYSADAGTYTPVVIPSIENTKELWMEFARALPEYGVEILMALLPIVGFFFIMQFLFLKMKKPQVIRILVGMVYTYIGLTLFLTSANVGFMPAGNYLGQQLASLSYSWILIPVGMLLGYYIVKAEPAVLVLNKQVEDITGGAISRKTMMNGLSIGMAISVGLAMVRIMTGISILWFLIPGYVLALSLTRKVPKIFTSIAFDSGGVASGPMTATFLLPFAMGACEMLGGNILTDAFGIVAMVAMTPLIIIQLIGVLYQRRMKKRKADEVVEARLEDEIIEWSEEEGV